MVALVKKGFHIVIIVDRCVRIFETFLPAWSGEQRNEKKTNLCRRKFKNNGIVLLMKNENIRRL